MRKLCLLLWTSLVSFQSISQQNPLWVRSIGGVSNFEMIRNMQRDPFGNLYVCGEFYNTADFDPGPGTALLTAPTSGPSASPACFVAKYDPAGNYLWAKMLVSIGGGTIYLDQNRNIFLTGYYLKKPGQFADFDPGPGVVNIDTLQGGGFFAKYDSLGNFQWVKAFPGTWFAPGNLVRDISGDILITGRFTGQSDFDPGPGVSYLNCTNQSGDGFFARYDSSGNYIWAKQIKSNIESNSFVIRTDVVGNIYLGGQYIDADFDPGPSTAFLFSSPSARSGFIAKYSSTGNYIWAKGLLFASGISASDDNGIFSMDLDLKNNIYVTGSFGNKVDFDPGLGLDTITSAGAEDVFIAKFDSSGRHQWAKRIGSTYPDEIGRSISASQPGYIYISGDFGSTVDFDPGNGISNHISHGLLDAFIVRMDTAGNYIWSETAGGSSDDYGMSAVGSPNSNDFFLGGTYENSAIVNSAPNAVSLTSAGGWDMFFVKYGVCSSLNTTVSQNGITLTAAATGVNYQWINCNGNQSIAGQTGQSFTATQNGNYAVIITQGSCRDTSSCFSIIGVGVEHLSTNQFPFVYPNPATDLLYINEAPREMTVEVLDISGRSVGHFSLKQGRNQLDIHSLPKGSYFLKIYELSGETKFQKLIKL